MIQVRDVLGRARPLAVAAVFTAAAFLPIAASHFASADALTTRSLLTTSSLASGSSMIEPGAAPGAATSSRVGHTYTFTVGDDTQDITSIVFSAWTTAFGYTGGGTAPADFDVTNSFAGATATVDGGSAVSGTFTRTGTNLWRWVPTAPLAVDPNDVVVVNFPATSTEYFTNPSANGTYFVHVSTHNSAVTFDNSTLIDEGTVTSSVSTLIDIETRVQETLKFSVEGDMRDGVAGNGGTPTSGTGAFNGPTDASTTCAPLTGNGSIKIGDLANNALAASDTYNGRSYFRLATNSARGAQVFYSAAPLTSGGEVIGIDGTSGNESTTFESALNTEQFGFAFDTTDSSLAELVADAGYDNMDTDDGWYAFAVTEDVDGNPVANAAPVRIASSPGVVSCDTGALTYVANIAEDTAAGIYSTRITYIASPSY